jgi:hypothetical protein
VSPTTTTLNGSVPARAGALLFTGYASFNKSSIQVIAILDLLSLRKYFFSLHQSSPEIADRSSQKVQEFFRNYSEID